jgi:hypothetical protein
MSTDIHNGLTLWHNEPRQQHLCVCNNRASSLPSSENTASYEILYNLSTNYVILKCTA